MPSTQLRQTVLAKARRVVVKLGTQLLTNEAGRIDPDYLKQMAGQVAELTRRGYEMTLVCSGAVGAGCAELGLASRPTDVAEQQAVAAVGQPRLMALLHEAFAAHGLKVAQLLLTRGDFEDRVRFLNMRNCIHQLQHFGVIPILNENDTVAVDELRFGDNDMLAALTCNGLRAHVLVLLTVVHGLLDPQNKPIDLVQNVADVVGVARAEKSRLGTGGINSKMESARLVTGAGEIAVIAHGRTPDVLLRLLSGEAGIGTVFAPAQRKLDSRARWIGLTKKPAGIITVDAGAAKAVCQSGRSLLATGITAVEGAFGRGAVVCIADGEGLELARGLSNYSDDEVRQIMGKKSTQFEKILGHASFTEVVHRNNMVVTKS
jgi:glutamate 5-kinase